MAEEMYPQPSVSRIVHYKDNENRCLAALITEVREEGDVALEVWPPLRNSFATRAVEGTVEGTWHWPERV